MFGNAQTLLLGQGESVGPKGALEGASRGLSGKQFCSFVCTIKSIRTGEVRHTLRSGCFCFSPKARRIPVRFMAFRKGTKGAFFMDFSTTIKKLGIEQALTYVFREPEKNLRKLIDWAPVRPRRVCAAAPGGQRGDHQSAGSLLSARPPAPDGRGC